MLKPEASPLFSPNTMDPHGFSLQGGDIYFWLCCFFKFLPVPGSYHVWFPGPLPSGQCQTTLPAKTPHWTTRSGLTHPGLKAARPLPPESWEMLRNNRHFPVTLLFLQNPGRCSGTTHTFQ